MAMVLQPTRLRLTQAIYFGKPPGGGGGSVVAVGQGNGITTTPNPIAVGGTVSLGPLSSDHDFGAFNIQSLNSAQVFNVRAFSAVGDGKTVADAAMGAGSATLTSASNPFVLADVGKLITVDGAGAAGVTLVTTIAGFTNAGQITLTAPNASGGPVAAKRVFWGTDNAAALNAAAVAAATQPSGNVVQIDSGRYMVGSALTLDSLAVILRGTAGVQSGSQIGSQLIFTQAAGTCISVQPTSGSVHFDHLNIRVENTAFAGSVIKATGSFVLVNDCLFDGAHMGAATNVDLTAAVTGEYSIRECNFTGGAYGINGGQVSNITRIESCRFSGQSVMPIKDLGQASTITGCTFEGLGSGTITAAAIDQSNAHGLDIAGNWFGDSNSNAAGQSWIKISGNGISIHGNYISSGAQQNVTAIKMTAICGGVSITGNEIPSGGAGTVGIDGGGFAHTGVLLGSNSNTALTQSTGFTLANILSTREGAQSRWGIGHSVPDSFGYGAGISVFEVKGGATGASGYGILQMTGALGDGVTTISGQVEFTQPTNTLGDVRLATINGGYSGTTANNRGGKLTISTKKDAGALTSAVVVDKDQNVGIQATPTRTLDLNGTQRYRGIAAPAVSEANSGTIYFDSAANKFKVSLNGGAYVDLVGSGGLTGSGALPKIAYWDSATSLNAPLIYVDPATSFLGIGVAVPLYAIDVTGDINLSTGSVVRVNAGTVFQTIAASASTAIGGVNGTLSTSDTAIGAAALAVSTGGGTGFNTMVGSSAGQALTTGNHNTGIGAAVLVATTIGTKNVAIGDAAGGTNTTGTNNIFIGSGADATVGNLNHACAIGTGASIADSNALNIGGGIQKVGIATSTPKCAFDVNGAVAMRQLTVTLVNGLNSDITSLVQSSWWRIEGPTGGFSVGGFVLGSSGVSDGMILAIYNSTSQQMTIVNEDASSTAIQRIKTLTGGNVVLRAGTSAATFRYDSVEDRWILCSQN